MSSLSELIDKLVSFQSEESREMLTGHFLGFTGYCIAYSVAAIAVTGAPWPSLQALVVFLVALLATVALNLFMLAMCAGVNDDKTRSTKLASFAIFLIGTALLTLYSLAQG